MRLKIGPSSSLVSRVKPATTANPAPTSTAPTSAVPVKADLALSFANIDPNADPMLVQVVIPPYDPTTFNSLVSLTAVVIGFGAGKPSDANGWIGSSHPKLTLEQAPATTNPTPVDPAAFAAAAGATIPAISGQPATPAATLISGSGVVSGAASADPLAPATPVVPVPPITPIANYLPGHGGGTATFLISGVPNGKFEIQLIEGYDV